MPRLTAVVVLGGTTGLGAHISRGLAGRGFAVAALGPIPPDWAWPDQAHDCHLVETDLDRIEGYAEAMGQASRLLGGFGALVNALDRFDPAPFDQITPAAWSSALHHNLKAVFFACQAAVPWMKADGGVICNLGSVRSRLAAVDQTVYSAAKAAVAAMTRDLACDLGRHNIKCDTLMLPVEGLDGLVTAHPVGPADVCEAVEFLISQGSFDALDAFEYPLDGGLSILLDRLAPAPRPAPPGPGSQVAVVTGGASGLGAQAARVFAQRGFRVALLDILDAPGQALAEELRQSVDACFVHCDMARNDQIEAAVQAVEDRFGRIDVLLNSAAITSRKRTPDITEADWDNFMDIDLKGPFYMSLACARRMRQHGGGHIVNFSSMLSTLSHGRHTLYGGAKEALNAMTRSLAAALKPDGVQVVSVLPAYVVTPMISFRLTDQEWIDRNYRQSLSRVLLLPEHVSEAFHFLSTSQTAAHGGHKIHVDTGYLALRHKLVPWDEPAPTEQEVAVR
ncbi:MAG: SDR family NAD(P)-dependent oxidoreductase [Propionibacteriaceae bacterium]|jgi:NAD(P)-dependent dehydrogenase (short-subunit alcohol dehydrogenase family)|nr:SDR family NAD(P)-dependent oxidoreductase [Propionibacteriaceae bacterium]